MLTFTASVFLISFQLISPTWSATQAEVDANENLGRKLRARFEALLTARSVSDADKLSAIDRLGKPEQVILPDQPRPTLATPSSTGFKSLDRRVFRISSQAASLNPAATTTNTGFVNPCEIDDPRKCCKQDTSPILRSSTVVGRYTCTNSRANSHTYRCGRWWRRRRCTGYRTGYSIGTCTRTEIRFTSVANCCPFSAYTCCLGFVYVKPITINVSDTMSIELEAQCVTVDKFIEILQDLECRVDSAKCFK